MIKSDAKSFSVPWRRDSRLSPVAASRRELCPYVSIIYTCPAVTLAASSGPYRVQYTHMVSIAYSTPAMQV
jgi:hypothetical protein